MENKTKTKQLLKILIGAAWIDGTIQPQERKYLHQMAAEQEVANDPEIKSLLFEAKPIEPAQCYQWIENYWGDRPSQEDHEHLLEALSALIYSDDNVDLKEAELLNRIQSLELSKRSPKSLDKLLKAIQKLYQQGISQRANE